MQKEIKKSHPIIEKLFGCMKGKEKPRLTAEQRDKIAYEMTEEKGIKLFKEFGFSEDEIVK